MCRESSSIFFHGSRAQRPSRVPMLPFDIELLDARPEIFRAHATRPHLRRDGQVKVRLEWLRGSFVQ